MTNAVRGESELNVKGIGRVTLCVTLATMACLEDHFQVANLDEAVAKIGAETSSTNLAVLLHALTLGGPREYSIDEIRHWPVSPGEIGGMMRNLMRSNQDLAGNGSDAPEPNRATRRAAPKAR